jgi:hypothetical protein
MPNCLFLKPMLSDGGGNSQLNMTPTVGRIVHYKTPANDEWPERTLAALITAVNNDGTVNLCCFGMQGLGYRRNVSEGSGLNQWSWPPRV